MKVDNPRFKHNEVICADCPFTDGEGAALKHLRELCIDWRNADLSGCPMPGNYSEACKLAEEVSSAV